MLTFSILWVMFAAAITAMALIKRSAAGNADHAESPESGKVLAFIAVLSSLLLLAGFVYVGSSLVLSL
jgi:hypothetical protein